MTYSQPKDADQDHIEAIKKKTSPCWGLSRHSDGDEHCLHPSYFLLIKTKSATTETLLNF